jgi:hypothetical protein
VFSFLLPVSLKQVTNCEIPYLYGTPTANLTTFQKGPFYFVIKVFNHLSTSIKKPSHDTNHFRSALSSFLVINSSYSEEYRSLNSVLLFTVLYCVDVYMLQDVL